MNRQSRFNAGYRKLGAGALGWPRGMVWGGRWERGSGWGTHVHPWQMHVNVWQIQYCKVNNNNNKEQKESSPTPQFKSINSFVLSFFLIVQPSHLYMTTGKTIALTRQTFVDKVMSLLFNMLSRLVITFLPRSKRLLISWLQSPSAVILEPPPK